MSQRNKAQNHCANWNTGKCSAVMFEINKERKAGYKYSIGQHMDEELEGKDCKVDKGCTYFDNFVLPGLVGK